MKETSKMESSKEEKPNMYIDSIEIMKGKAIKQDTLAARHSTIYIRTIKSLRSQTEKECRAYE